MSSIVLEFPLYRVTEGGEVFSSRLKENLVQSVDKDGYRFVMLYPKNGTGKNRRVHRLVALSFLPNPDRLPEVNHLDGDKSNNSSGNLEWVSSSQNQQHAYDTGLQARGPDMWHSKNSVSSIETVCKLLVVGGATLKEIASASGVSLGTVKQVKYRKGWKHVSCKYQWRGLSKS